MSAKTLYASAARTATPTAVTFNAHHAQGVRIFIDATAITSTPSVVCTVDLLDSLSGKWGTILTMSAVTAVSTVVGLVPTPGDRLRVTMTHADTDSITYTVTAHIIE